MGQLFRPAEAARAPTGEEGAHLLPGEEQWCSLYDRLLTQARDARQTGTSRGGTQALSARVWRFQI